MTNKHNYLQDWGKKSFKILPWDLVVPEEPKNNDQAHENRQKKTNHATHMNDQHSEQKRTGSDTTQNWKSHILGGTNRGPKMPAVLLKNPKFLSFFFGQYSAKTALVWTNSVATKQAAYFVLPFENKSTIIQSCLTGIQYESNYKRPTIWYTVSLHPGSSSKRFSHLNGEYLHRVDSIEKYAVGFSLWKWHKGKYWKFAALYKSNISWADFLGLLANTLPWWLFAI